MAVAIRVWVGAGAALVALGAAVSVPVRAAEAIVGRPLPAWQKGMLDIHQINTGLGDAALLVLPDGTTWLLDAGAVQGRPRAVHYDAPPRPNGARRGGEWIVRYIRAMHPQGMQAVLDYAMLTHFHDDHMGTLTKDAPRAKSGDYQLTGITDVGEQIPVRELLDRGTPDYAFPQPVKGPMMDNYRSFLRWQTEQRGLQVRRFEAGRNDQIVLRHAPKDYPQFEVRNIAANGAVWTGTGTEARSAFPADDLPSENNCSLAFRLRYGRFVYFNGGDMSGEAPAAKPWRDMEAAVAKVVGPVDVHALNHHGTKDAVNAFFLGALQPRVHIASVYACSQPAPDVMRRMLSEAIYPGPRDIFLTNTTWEGRRMNMDALFGEKDAAWLETRIAEATGGPGHVVVRVAAGGDSYRVFVLDDASEILAVKSVHGPYPSR